MARHDGAVPSIGLWALEVFGAENVHFGCTCYHPLFVFNQFGDVERCALRPAVLDPWGGCVSPSPNSSCLVWRLLSQSMVQERLDLFDGKTRIVDAKQIDRGNETRCEDFSFLPLLAAFIPN